MAIIPQTRMIFNGLERKDDLQRFKLLLDGIDDEPLMQYMEKMRGKGRNEYPVRVLWNCLLAMVVFGRHLVCDFIREMRRNDNLCRVVGLDMNKELTAIPRPYVFSRFFKLLRKPEANQIIKKMFDGLVEELGRLLPDFGAVLAVDSKGIPSFANRKSKRRKADGRSEKDADVGVKTYYKDLDNGKQEKVQKKWFGYKVHFAVDAKYELPVVYEVTKASVHDCPVLEKLMERMKERHLGILKRCEYLTADRGYDSKENNANLFDTYGIVPVIDIRDMWKDGEETRLLDPTKAGNIVYDYRGDIFCICPMTGEKRPMVYWGYEDDRQTLKYRCPASALGVTCKGKKQCCRDNKYGRTVRVPLELERRVFVPLPRSTPKWQRIYNKRTSIERVNSRLDVSFGFENHTIRGKKKMALSVGISFIVMLGMAVGHIKANEKHLIRSLVGSVRAA